MKKTLTLVFALLLTAAVFATERPNVIFILCDDLGYGDVGFTLRERDRKAVAAIRTPTLDRLAAGGVVLTDHVCAAPVCIASRASIMTGQLQLDGHCSVRHNQFDYPIAETNTLGSVMKRAGYHTMAIGKWGIGGGGESGKPRSAHPLLRGFDRYYGFLDHKAGHTYYHYDGTWGGVYMGVWEGSGDPSRCVQATDTAAGRYSTDVFIAKAKAYISDAVKGHAGEPFFLFMAVNTVHGSGRSDSTLADASPLHVPGRPYPAGGYGAWPIPEEPLADRNTWIDPRYRDLALTDAAKRYATTVSRLDDAMADLMDHLERLGVAKDTVIIFTSDNGPANEYGADTRFFNSAGGFDGLKRSVYEGGERMPTFVSWPNGGLAAGSADSAPSISVDWLPTLADIGGVAPGASDGVSLLPRLRGEKGFPESRIEVDYIGSPGAGPDQAAFAARKGVVSGRQTMARTNNIVSISIAGGKVRRYDLSVDPHQDFDLNATPAATPATVLSPEGDVTASWIDEKSGDAVARPLRMAMRVDDTSGVAEFSGDKLPVIFDDGFEWSTDGLVFGKGRKGCLQRFEQRGGCIAVLGESLVFADGPATVNYIMEGGTFTAANAVGRLSVDGQARVSIGGGEAGAKMTLGGLVSGDAPGRADRLAVLPNGTLELGKGGLSFSNGHVFTLAGGTLRIAASATLASARPVAIAADSTVDVAPATVATVAAAVSGEGAITKTGAGALDFAGSIAGLKGALSVVGGSATLRETGLSGLAVSVAPGARLTVAVPSFAGGKEIELFATTMDAAELAEGVVVTSDGRMVEGVFSVVTGRAVFTPES